MGRTCKKGSGVAVAAWRRIGWQWQQHVEGLGKFVVGLGDEFVHVASLLDRQATDEVTGFRVSRFAFGVY